MRVCERVSKRAREREREREREENYLLRDEESSCAHFCNILPVIHIFVCYTKRITGIIDMICCEIQELFCFNFTSKDEM